jgi:hypothetical protein
MKWLHRGQRGAKATSAPIWLEGYTGQATAELIRLEEGHRLDSLVLAFEQALDQKAGRMGLGGLSEPERVVLAIEAIEREVNNGGYDQLFRNSSTLAVYFVPSLLSIGCPEVAGITERAIKALKLKGAITVEAIDTVMEKDNERRDDRLANCDEEYFSSAGDLAGPLFAYIKANQDKISLP